MFPLIRTKSVLAAVAVAASLALASNGTASAAEPPGAIPSGSHVVASGPGFVIVGEGARVEHPQGAMKITRGSGTATPLSVTDCGWVSCSLYLSRAQTRWLNYNIALAGGALASGAAFCGLAALISGLAAVFVGIGCAVFWAVYGAFLWNAVTHAAGDNGCLRIRYGALGFAFYDDHSGFCHNT